MIDWLTSAAFTAFGAPTTWAEVLGFATGLVNVALLVRQHILNWPLGILNVLLLMLVFWSSGLYADAGLQIVYVVLGLYGWWAWLYGGERRSRLVVRATTRASICSGSARPTRTKLSCRLMVRKCISSGTTVMAAKVRT